jgi:hypothetical protein
MQRGRFFAFGTGSVGRMPADRDRRPPSSKGGKPGPKGGKPGPKGGKAGSQGRKPPSSDRRRTAGGNTRKGSEAPRRSKPADPGGFGPFSSGRTDKRAEEPRRSSRDSRRSEPEAERPQRPSSLRVTGQRRPRPETPGKSRKPARRPGSDERPVRRRRKSGSADVRDEIMRLGGRRGERLYRRLTDAADAYSRDHERDALRILKPLREELPDSPSVRELYGLSLYRAGRFPAAAKELAAFVELTGSVEQHPVLMDCYRAQRRWAKVEELWQELASVSPGPELVTEGRIVAAGALADRGRVDDAITLLARRDRPVQRVRDYHLRLWYALGDLEERAGNLPRARAMFQRVRTNDAAFADVAERLAALG